MIWAEPEDRYLNHFHKVQMCSLERQELRFIVQLLLKFSLMEETRGQGFRTDYTSLDAIGSRPFLKTRQLFYLSTK